MQHMKSTSETQVIVRALYPIRICVVIFVVILELSLELPDGTIDFHLG